MADFIYGARPGAVPLLTAELNALANASLTSFGPEITPGVTANLTFRHLRGDLALRLAPNSLAFTAASFVIVYFAPAADGTNYPKLSGANMARANYRVGTIALYPATPSAEAIYENIRGVAIPNAPFKVVLENQSGVALPASGNTLDLYPQAVAY